MFIPIHISVRGVIVASIMIAILSVLGIQNISKEKIEYESIIGKIEYLEKEYQHLPSRHKGDFRYIVVSGYPYPFEIFIPNSRPTEKTVDDLRINDTVKIYYYEINNTHKIELNKFVQFIDKDEIPYFIRNSFQKKLGYFILGSCLMMILGSIILWKMNKIKW